MNLLQLNMNLNTIDEMQDWSDSNVLSYLRNKCNSLKSITNFPFVHAASVMTSHCKKEQRLLQGSGI
jgi:hypothetical protein